MGQCTTSDELYYRKTETIVSIYPNHVYCSNYPSCYDSNFGCKGYMNID